MTPSRASCDAITGNPGGPSWIWSRSPLRQVQPDVQLPQLLRRYRRGSAHEQVLRPLVHWEEHDLPQVLLVREQHDDAVDAWRDSAMRGRAILQGAVHAAELLDDDLLAIPGDLEGLAHDV